MNGRRGGGMIYMWFYPCLFTSLFGEIERAHQWHLRATGGVGTGDGTCPQPGNHSSFAAAVFFGQSDFGVKMPNTLFGFITHPLAIVADIVGQSSRAMPVAAHQRLMGLRVDWWASGKLWWDFYEGFVNQHGHWIE